MVVAYNRYAESNIPINYWDLDMVSFKGADGLLSFYKELNIQSVYNSGQSFFLIGPHGTGKSSTATNILKSACHKNYSCLYTTLSDIVASLLDAPFEEKFLSRKELTIVDFLVIDEVDSRFSPSENSSDLFGRTLEQIFRTRLQNKIPMILCSNSPNPIEMFSGAIKESLDSLYSSTKMIVAIGEDFRKNKG